MPITRTTWIDDDGSGTVGTIINNAEKTLLYNQIDANPSALTPWGVYDYSGAGLALTGPGGFYCKLGGLVYIWIEIIYPSTVNAGAAKLGALPFLPATAKSGLVQTYGVLSEWFIQTGDAGIYALNPDTGNPRTNANLSGTTNVLSGLYFTTA